MRLLKRISLITALFAFMASNSLEGQETVYYPPGYAYGNSYSAAQMATTITVGILVIAAIAVISIDTHANHHHGHSHN